MNTEMTSERKSPRTRKTKKSKNIIRKFSVKSKIMITEVTVKQKSVKQDYGTQSEFRGFRNNK